MSKRVTVISKYTYVSTISIPASLFLSQKKKIIIVWECKKY